MILQSFCHKFFCQKCSATRIVSQSLTLFEATNSARERGTDGGLQCAVLLISQVSILDATGARASLTRRVSCLSLRERRFPALLSRSESRHYPSAARGSANKNVAAHPTNSNKSTHPNTALNPITSISHPTNSDETITGNEMQQPIVLR